MRAAPQRELGLRGGVPVLAVDAGQTEIRAALAHSGRGPSTATAPGVLRMGERTGPEEVAAALLAAVAALGPLPEPLPPLGVGLTSYAGNVFRAGAPLLEPFTQEVLRRRPATELLPPAGDSLAGAALLAGMEDGLRPQAGLLWRAAA